MREQDNIMKRSRLKFLFALAAALVAPTAANAGICPPADVVKSGIMGDFQLQMDHDKGRISGVSAWQSAILKRDAAATFLARMQCTYETNGGGALAIEWLAGSVIRERIETRPEWALEENGNGGEILKCTKGLLDCHWF
jgi:hypothetical protein